LWHLFSIEKRVTENSTIGFQIFEINRSFLECVGSSWIYATSWFWTEEVVTVGLAQGSGTFMAKGAMKPTCL